MKPSQIEDEHIWVQEMQLRMERLARQQQEQSAAEKQRLKEAHWMHCPKCGNKLAKEICGAVEIDVCPSCYGVWLDKGELGAIVESTEQGSFFHKCLHLIRKGSHASQHLPPHLAQ
jgi:uncharacterized protein